MTSLGDKARDKITGLTGIVTAIYTFLHGCRRICITPQELKDGKPVEGTVFDEPQTEVVEPKAYARKSDSEERKTGGPNHQPSPNRSCPVSRK